MAGSPRPPAFDLCATAAAWMPAAGAGITVVRAGPLPPGEIMQKLFFDHALIGDGWADNVTITHEAGAIAAIECDSVRGDSAYGGSIALPGLPNLHSHTFQRGMAGLAETRGPSGDSFWTWRQVMYGFLGALTPEDVE